MKLNQPLQFKNKVFQDLRGTFCPMSLPQFQDTYWQQVSLVESRKNTLRGLHFQAAPFEQNKIVICLEGLIQDVCVDLKTGDIHSFILEPNDGVIVPRGFCHGILTIQHSKHLYVVDNQYNPSFERFINPLDPDLGITWGKPIEGDEALIMTERDRLACSFRERFTINAYGK